jgi:hypothetical protein
MSSSGGGAASMFFTAVLVLIVASVIVTLVADVWLHWWGVVGGITVAGWAAQSMSRPPSRPS